MSKVFDARDMAQLRFLAQSLAAAEHQNEAAKVVAAALSVIKPRRPRRDNLVFVLENLERRLAGGCTVLECANDLLLCADDHGATAGAILKIALDRKTKGEST